MLCERCRVRDATVRVDAVAPDGQLVRRTEWCAACAASPRRIRDEDCDPITPETQAFIDRHRPREP